MIFDEFILEALNKRNFEPLTWNEYIDLLRENGYSYDMLKVNIFQKHCHWTPTNVVLPPFGKTVLMCQYYEDIDEPLQVPMITHYSANYGWYYSQDPQGGYAKYWKFIELPQIEKQKK